MFVAVIGSEVPAAAELPVEESTPVVEEEAGTSRIIVLTELCPAAITSPSPTVTSPSITTTSASNSESTEADSSSASLTPVSSTS